MQFSAIVISGAPGAGKSTIAARLGAELGWPVLSKDIVKESLLESLGWQDRAVSRKLGAASFHLLLSLAKSFYKNNAPFILESAFRKSDGPILLETLPGATVLQVYCEAQDAVCLQRFRDRMRSGDRHPGHADTEGESDLQAYLAQGLFGTLDIEGPCIEIDTNDYSSELYEHRYQEIINVVA